MTDLDEKEQNHVRAALNCLRRRVGGWEPLAKALGFTSTTVNHVAYSRRKTVSASMAFRVARLAEISVDDLLAGRFLPPGACPHCGHVPTSDFTDEQTIVESAARPTLESGLSLVR